MTALKIALDWTPNTNHTGFFVAQQLGFYRQLGLEVEISHPGDDNYAITPAKKLELGQVDLAVAPSESVISFNTKSAPFAVKAIAALLQEDLSAIVTLNSSNISRPQMLDGKIYASYKARYEDHIVKQMIINDGGKGNLQIIYPEKLGIWSTLLAGKADATWVFMNWEGEEARQKGILLNAFRLADYGIPYGYSPVIMASEEKIATHGEVYRKFLQGTRQGFLYAQDHPEESVAILTPFLTDYDRTNLNLLECQRATAPFYGTANTWGKMQPHRVQSFLEWLHNTGLEPQATQLFSKFSNELLD
ncbi:MAG: ABC transporter substrate-binding protein [Cytophagales bacterium]|nr:ABC transporter substrate-binding protein [Bernardetiaceae bacterium]MDW8209604.1 ABC transporter substrate-binding protein [Cytophagales bacterium]